MGDTLRSDFANCGEVARVHILSGKGIAFVQYKDEEGHKKALEWHNTWYKGRTLTVKKASEDEKGKGKDKDGKGEGKGKRERNDEFTIIVKGIGYDTDPDTLRNDFSGCGEVARIHIPKD